MPPNPGAKMRFPGQRKSKHYFPVNARDLPLLCIEEEACLEGTHVIGIDQTMVDIEANVEREMIERYGLSFGHSNIVEDDKAEANAPQKGGGQTRRVGNELPEHIAHGDRIDCNGDAHGREDSRVEGA